MPGTTFCHLIALWGRERSWWKDFWCLAEDGHRPEWTFYPRFSSNIHTYHVGKQCFFNGVFLGNRRSLSERMVDECFGRKKSGNVFLLDLDCAVSENTWVVVLPGQHSTAGVSPRGSPCYCRAARKIGKRRGCLAILFGKEPTTYADPHFCFSLHFIKC